MAQQVINNGETGVVVRDKLNDNFTELYADVDGHVIKEAGSALPIQSGLNFNGSYFDLTDNAPNTDVNFSAAAQALLGLAHTAASALDTATIDMTVAAGQIISGNVIDDSITNAKLANVPTQTFKGRTTAATGDPEDLTQVQALAVLGLTGHTTHTGEVTGSGALTLDPTAISNRSVVAIDRAADHILFHDASGAVLAKALGSTMDLVNDTTPELGGTLDGLLQQVINLQLVDIDGLATYGAGGVEALKPPFIGVLANHTWDYQINQGIFGNNLILPSVLEFSGTQTLNKSMGPLGGGFLFYAGGVVKNTNGLAITINPLYTLANQVKYQADGAIVTLTGLGIDYYSNPTFNRINAGTISGSAAFIQSLNSSPVIDTGVTIGTRLGVHIVEPTGAGTLNNQVGVLIHDLVKGATNDSEIVAGQATVPTGDFNFYQGNEKRSRFNGAREYKIRAVAAARTLDNTDHAIEYTGGANADMTLPQASTCKGREYILKKTAAGHPSFKRFAGDTIDGAAADLQLAVAKQARTIMSNGGTDWLITGSYL